MHHAWGAAARYGGLSCPCQCWAESCFLARGGRELRDYMLAWLKSQRPTGQSGVGSGSGVVPRIVVLFLLFDLITSGPRV